MTAIARRYEISARRTWHVERNICLYVIIIIFELAGIYTDQVWFTLLIDQWVLTQ